MTKSGSYSNKKQNSPTKLVGLNFIKCGHDVVAVKTKSIMIFHANNRQLRVDLKTLETKEIYVDGVSCKKFGETIHSFHHYDLYDKKGNKLVAAGEIEGNVIYLPRDTPSEAVSLLPYLFKEYGRGLRLINISLVDFLNYIGWYHNVDTDCFGITQVRTSNVYLGSEQVFSLDFWGNFAYCKMGERGDDKIKEIEGLKHSQGRLIDMGRRDTSLASERLKQLPVGW